MLHRFTNFLPSDRARVFRRDYFLRLLVCACILASIVLAVHGAMLVPTYVYHHSQQAAARTLEMELSRARGVVNGEDESGVGDTATQITQLLEFTSVPTASAVLQKVLAVPHTGIVIQGLSFTSPLAKGGEGILAIRGIAATREELRRYSVALSDLPFVSKADLPLSAYAKEKAIPFTITLTGTLQTP